MGENNIPVLVQRNQYSRPKLRVPVNPDRSKIDIRVQQMFNKLAPQDPELPPLDFENYFINLFNSN